MNRIDRLEKCDARAQSQPKQYHNNNNDGRRRSRYTHKKNRVAFCIQSYWFHLIVDTAHQHFHNKNWWDRQWHFWLHAHTHKLNCQTMEIIYRLRPDWSRWYNVMSNNVKVPLMEECLIENAGCWLNRCINAQNRNRWLVV